MFSDTAKERLIYAQLLGHWWIEQSAEYEIIAMVAFDLCIFSVSLPHNGSTVFPSANLARKSIFLLVNSFSRYKSMTRYKLVKEFNISTAQQVTAFSAINGFYSCIQMQSFFLISLCAMLQDLPQQAVS